MITNCTSTTTHIYIYSFLFSPDRQYQGYSFQNKKGVYFVIPCIFMYWLPWLYLIYYVHVSHLDKDLHLGH